MLRIAVCDDDPEIHRQFRSFFARYGETLPLQFQVKYFQSGEDLLLHYGRHGRYAFHLLFMDVEMNGLSGIDTAQRIRGLPDHSVQIIFLTYFPQYMADSFSVQPYHFEMKPVSYESLKSLVERATGYINAAIRRHIAIKTIDGEVMIPASRVIAAVKAGKLHVKIITMHQDYLSTLTLTELSAKLDAGFYQIHRSAIVNLEHIHKFKANRVVMCNKESFPLGRSRKKGVTEAYVRFRLDQFDERGYMR
ncbi:LytTR family DNA-binding domain-containing protein [Paenibacillus sp. M1]|uniref:LytTR family DNA-binding domain-containing protein n=1 Tax=Paenibacillus haidiansis TaxID=1574488 RepID=A0ABU7VQ33_9BACL